MSRSIKACMNCGETREIAAHGLCFKCYRQEERTLADDLWARPDPHAKDLAKTQRRTRKGLMKLMDGLEEVEIGKLVPQETIEAWRFLLRPEIERIALSLGEVRANSELETADEEATESAEEPGEPVNSEQETASEPSSESTLIQNSEQVNSEQIAASDEFTQSAEPSNLTNGIYQSSTEQAETAQSPLLPPILPQRVTKMNKQKGNSHAA